MLMIRTRSPLRNIVLALVFACFTALAMIPAPARACGGSCGCDAVQHGDVTSGTRGLIAYQHQMLRWHISEEFDDWELFLIQVFFMEHFLPAMMLMTQQLTSVAYQQMEILGAFFDAKHQLETQQLFETLKAEAHKDYHPSTGMCVFGTISRSLAASERRAESVSFILSQRAQDRGTGHVNTAGAEGAQQEKRDRLTRFTSSFCNTHDNGTGLTRLCGTTSTGQGPNSDVDYTRIIDRKLTLDLDLMDGTAPTDDERDVFALMENLYSHDVMTRIPETSFRNADTNKMRILDLRSVVAKRSVAENSFNAIVGMRAAGSPTGAAASALGPAGSSEDTAQYMRIVLRQMGMTDDEQITEMLGERPSYYAQMDMLTKKLYQRPEFYTDLYDKPANIDRKLVSMQAIGLMQDFDTLKSYLRQEMILAVMVELELIREQTLVDDGLAAPKHSGDRYNRGGGPAGGPAP